MGKIKLSHGKFAIVDDEDLHYLKRFTWQYVNVNGIETVRRSQNTKFGISHINIEDYIVNRPGGSRSVQVFKNGDRLDFRKENIEFIGIEGVKQRARKQKGTSSIYKGVTKNNYRGKPWRAQIEKGARGSKEYKCFVTFRDTEEECAEWYNKKAIELFGPHAYQNKIKK